MYLSDEAVVLQFTPYQSSSAVITCFTKEHGKQAFMVNGYGSGKSKNHRRIHFIDESYDDENSAMH